MKRLNLLLLRLKSKIKTEIHLTLSPSKAIVCMSFDGYQQYTKASKRVIKADACSHWPASSAYCCSVTSPIRTPALALVWTNISLLSSKIVINRYQGRLVAYGHCNLDHKEEEMKPCAHVDSSALANRPGHCPVGSPSRYLSIFLSYL